MTSQYHLFITWLDEFFGHLFLLIPSFSATQSHTNVRGNSMPLCIMWPLLTDHFRSCTLANHWFTVLALCSPIYRKKGFVGTLVLSLLSSIAFVVRRLTCPFSIQLGSSHMSPEGSQPPTRHLGPLAATATSGLPWQPAPDFLLLHCLTQGFGKLAKNLGAGSFLLPIAGVLILRKGCFYFFCKQMWRIIIQSYT